MSEVGTVKPTVRRGERYSLLRLDPILKEGLDARELRAAERILVPMAAAAVGPWKPPPRVASGAGDLGFLVVDGLLTRRVMVAETRCTELLGQGDIVRPWSMDAPELSSVPIEADWRVIDRPARFAVLDPNVTRQLGRWPQITCELFDRTVRRARWLSFQLAASHTKHVETRLLMVLWQFADRWGRVGTDGVRVGLQLSHQALGEIVGARRQTVTSALGKLRDSGELSVVDHGCILLRGRPPFDTQGSQTTSAGPTA